jgi:DNA-binding CsgD family transcriptional regulator
VDAAARGAIIGRAAELYALDQLVTGVTAGRGGVGWIQGEPGIGKSALIDAVLARASMLGCTVFRGAGDALMEAFPLRLMADCLRISGPAQDSARSRIAALLRGEGGEAGAVDPVLAAGEQMLELVDLQCANGPVVLAVEDLHWADEPTLLLWSRLARAVEQIPLLLIGVARPLPHRVMLDRLREAVAKRTGAAVELGPLEPASVVEFGARIAGGVPGPRLRATLARAGGNPLYLRELMDALLRDDLVVISGAAAELRGDGDATPTSLHLAIRSRLGFVPESTRKILRMAALLGNEFDVAELATVTARPVRELAELLTDAVEGGVIRDAGGRFRFRHELIHQVLLGETPQAVLGALRSEIAQLVAAAGGGVDAVARHLLAVAGPMADWALGWLAGVPESALHALPQVSVELFGRAVDAVGEDHEHAEALATRLAQVLFWLGHDERAAEVAETVIRRTRDPLLATKMRIQLIRSAGRMRRYEAALTALLRPGDDELPPLWRARLGAWSAMMIHDSGRTEDGAALALQALDWAGPSGDALSIASARHAASICCGAASRPAYIEAALEALTSPDPESMDLRMLVLSNHVTQSDHIGQQDEAEAALAEALRLADRIGTARAGRIRAIASDFCYRHGRWDEALVHLAGLRPDVFDAERASHVHALGAMIALQRGDRDGADAYLRAAVGEESALAELVVLDVPIAEALAMRAEAEGNLARAVRLMAARLSAPRHPDEHPDDMPELLRLALATGDSAIASAAVAQSEADVALNGQLHWILTAESGAALVGRDADRLLAVGDRYREVGWPPRSAFALEEAAVLLAQDGDVGRARMALTDVARIYTNLGATWSIRRADGRLRPFGVRRGPRSVHRRATTGWAALTPSEERIARLVARGASNPDIASELFLSRSTVQTHVSNILAKLGARSRVDIVRAVAEHPSED